MKDYIEYAKNVIRLESEAVAGLADKLTDDFNCAVDQILNCKGRVIVTGMGKSGLIGKKIAATFNSTGVSSFFLHPVEALHGDLGLIRPEDIMMAISKSGQLDDLELLIAAARRLDIKLIAICGTPGSPMWERADIKIDVSVESEAGPNNLVPTSSATTTQVMGDALAIALLEARDFSPSDFASLHPGGNIGRRLLKRVHEFHHSGNEIPLVPADAGFSEMILEMTSKRLGCVLTVDNQNRLTGMFTDGDLRRRIQTGEDVSALRAGDVMIGTPKTIAEDSLLDAALALMEKHSITQLATVDDNGRLAGIIHLHDILKSKLV